MFYYPALFLQPDISKDVIEAGCYRLARRLWQTSIFDLATLATKHTLNPPCQVMDVFLGECHVEIGVDAKTREEAGERLQALRLSLYSEGVSPFIVPFVTTYSVNEYSGINGRDSPSPQQRLPEGLQEGLTSETGRVEAWPVELSFQCIVNRPRLTITDYAFHSAATKADEWRNIAVTRPAARAFAQAVLSAP